MKRPEIIQPLIVVIGAGTLIVLLFIMAAGYSALGLSDYKQALGLPEGSIRALIALLLLITFIVVGLYVFGTVGVTYPDAGYTITEEGKQLAPQIITLLGTLLGAVSGFYFGTASVAAARGILEQLSPIIRNIEPVQATQGTEVSLKITGNHFESPKSVRLVRGSEEMIGTNLLSNNNEIHCTIMVDKQPDGKWELVVVNDNGKEDRLANAFEILATPTASS